MTSPLRAKVRARVKRLGLSESLTLLAERYGVSRQRIHQYLKGWPLYEELRKAKPRGSSYVRKAFRRQALAERDRVAP